MERTMLGERAMKDERTSIHERAIEIERTTQKERPLMNKPTGFQRWPTWALVALSWLLETWMAFMWPMLDDEERAEYRRLKAKKDIKRG
jgi:hypothetical protein